MVSFQSPGNLSSYLVRGKLYPMDRKTGSFKCKGARFQECLNVSEMETFTSTVTHTSYKINDSLHCNDKLVVTQIVSDIVGTIIHVMTKKYAGGEACLQEHLFEHFNSEGHNGFLRDVSVTLIDKTGGKILLNSTGDIPSKRWHLMILMLTMISKLQFVFIFYWYHVLIFTYYHCNFNGDCYCFCCYCSPLWVTGYTINKVEIIVTMVIVMTSSTMGVASMLLLLLLLLLIVLLSI